MLDINKIRQNKEQVEQALLKRMDKAELKLDEILQLDDKRRELIRQGEELKAERNKHSKVKPTPDVIKKMKTFSLDSPFSQNPSKCKLCIYKELCDVYEDDE